MVVPLILGLLMVPFEPVDTVARNLSKGHGTTLNPLVAGCGVYQHERVVQALSHDGTIGLTSKPLFAKTTKDE